MPVTLSQTGIAAYLATATLPAGGAYTVPTDGAFAFSTDVFLKRDAANTLAQRNGVNAQTFRLYNTYTDGSNYERGVFDWNAAANIFEIGAKAAGTGTQRSVRIDGSTLIFRTGGSSRWTFDGSGNLIANADNTYDIGASGATRPKNIHVAGSVIVADDYTGSRHVRAGSAGQFYWDTKSVFASPTDGIVTVSNYAQTGFTRLQFGGTTASFPSIKRDGVGLSARLADDSAGTWLKVLRTTVASLPSASTSGAGAFAVVSDALTPALGTAVTGGGAAQIFVISDGTNWIAS